MQPQYKVGLIGLGEISTYFIRGVELNPRTELVAICRRKPLNEEEQKKYKAYKYYKNWNDLVDDSAVNCIIIATPPSTHAEITAYALYKNKKVIVDPWRRLRLC